MTENTSGRHIAKIVVYDKITREEITQIETNEDGTFKIELDLGIYDIVIKKESYLKKTLTNVELTDKMEKEINIGEYIMIAGDITNDGAITIDDFVMLNNNLNKTGICDLNEDGVVNEIDRTIVKNNYGKKAKTENFKDLASV
ncbi:MAG: hypothetical protein HFJ50_06915 [Clostridia bacterium]|nr:hypothetical protein [Clostridia bacterium]